MRLPCVKPSELDSAPLGSWPGGTRETILTVKVSQIGLGISLSTGSFDVASAPPEKEATAEATMDAKTVFVPKLFIARPLSCFALGVPKQAANLSADINQCFLRRSSSHQRRCRGSTRQAANALQRKFSATFASECLLRVKNGLGIHCSH
jgi:hypothetical protein